MVTRGDIILIICFSLFLIPLASSTQETLGTFQQGKDIQIIQLCDSCSSITISSINFPNSTTIVSNKTMSSLDGRQFNYTLNGTLLYVVGTYNVNGFDNNNEVFATDFDVTSNGSKFDVQTSIFYIGAMVLLSFFFLICLFAIGTLPSEDPRDNTGKLMDINYLKHLKLPLVGIAWGLLLAVSYLAWGIAEAYITSSGVVGIFKWCFTILMIGLIIFIPLMFLYTFVRFMEDKKMKRYIERGLM